MRAYRWRTSRSRQHRVLVSTPWSISARPAQAQRLHTCSCCALRTKLAGSASIRLSRFTPSMLFRSIRSLLPAKKAAITSPKMPPSPNTHRFFLLPFLLRPFCFSVCSCSAVTTRRLDGRPGESGAGEASREGSDGASPPPNRRLRKDMVCVRGECRAETIPPAYLQLLPGADMHVMQSPTRPIAPREACPTTAPLPPAPEIRLGTTLTSPLLARVSHTLWRRATMPLPQRPPSCRTSSTRARRRRSTSPPYAS